MSIFADQISRPELPLQLLDRAISVFEELKWSTDPGQDGSSSLFDRFCAMLSRLTPDEIELVLGLTPDFLHCVLSVEDFAIWELAKKLESNGTLRPDVPIHFLPLIKLGDEGRSKSGHAAVYALKSRIEPALKSAGIRYKFSVSFDSLSTNRKSRGETVVVLVDDFLGSGSTAESAIEVYHENVAGTEDFLVVGAFVAQRAAVRYLTDRGAMCAVGIERPSGIGDSNRIAEKEVARSLMRSLSLRLGFKDENHQLGYNGAEALVSFARCPNSTFPLYWSTREVDGSSWPAPFRR
jgi:hypothetical protein